MECILVQQLAAGVSANARALSAFDEKVPEGMICRVLGVGRTAIWRTRAAYLEGGLEYALRDAPRAGRRRASCSSSTKVPGIWNRISALQSPPRDSPTPGGRRN